MKRATDQQGLTLIELLVSIAILGFVLAGIYGMLDAGNKTFQHSRALAENNQTSREVLNYMLFRLREIDGSGLEKDPRHCSDCHTPQIDGNESDDNAYVPCFRDVRIPRRSLMIEELARHTLTPLTGVDMGYQNLSGYNSITFWADMLPITGYPDEFTDSPTTGPASGTRNGLWDLTTTKGDPTKYDHGSDAEVLYYDLNDDGLYDYYAEKWSFHLRKSANHESYELIETLAFTHTTDKGGVLDVSAKNTSSYQPYSAPIAYGITGLGIKVVPRIAPDAYPKPRETKLVDTSCGAPAGNDRDTCHGYKATNPKFNVYQNETAFSYAQFVSVHPWWNIKALGLELATTDPQGLRFMKMKQILVPRNVEVNKEYYKP